MGRVLDLSMKMTYKSYWFIAIGVHEILLWFYYGLKFSIIERLSGNLRSSLCSFQTQGIPINVWPGSKRDYLILINICYYFFWNQEKDEGFYLKMTDQINKFLFKTISICYNKGPRCLPSFESLSCVLFYAWRLSEEMWYVTFYLNFNIKTFSVQLVPKATTEKCFPK